MSDEKALQVLSSQHESRVKLLAEILKLYIHLLLVIAIAIFACLGLLVKLADADIDLQIPPCPNASLTVQVLSGFLMLAPLFILAWIAGHLFLRWNYFVVVEEMDCISSMLAKEMNLSGDDEKRLKHDYFLRAYAKPWWFKPLYGMLGAPVVAAYLLLGWLVVSEWGGTRGIVYGSFLAVAFLWCLVLAPWGYRRIERRRSALQGDRSAR